MSRIEGEVQVVCVRDGKLFSDGRGALKRGWHPFTKGQVFTGSYEGLGAFPFGLEAIHCIWCDQSGEYAYFKADDVEVRRVGD